MAIGRVPQRHRPALVALTSLSQDQIVEARRLLDNTSGTEESLQDVLSDVVDDGARALEALVTLTMVRLRAGEEPEETALSVLSVLGEEAGKGDISPLLETPHILRRAKFYDLAAAHHMTFQSARVLTDVRPLFEEDASLPIQSALITHTLELSYSMDGEEHDSYITLDRGDLIAIQNQVERALAKHESASGFIGKAGAHVMSLPGEIE